MAETEIESAVVNPNEELEHLDLKEMRRVCWPVSKEEGLQLPRCSIARSCPISKQLNKLTLNYPDDMNVRVSGSQSVSIKIGEPIDIVSLLSFNGEVSHLHRNTVGHEIPNKRYGEEQVVIEEKTFEGKYIMVCCFHAPFFHEYSGAFLAQGLASICLEMYQNRWYDFEMLLVVKTKININSRAIFDHFLSGFPNMCLVVSFEESKCRDFICKSLGLESSSVQCLIVDKEDAHAAAQRRVLLHQVPYFAERIGADEFPFTGPYVPNYLGSPSASSFHQLLGCEPTDVFDLKMATGGVRRVSVSELDKTVVGLYLCTHGDSMDIVNRMHRRCRSNNKEFEVVVVYLPYLASVDPVVFQGKIDRMLRDKNISLGCWPFNNSICRRLWELVSCAIEDVLVIVDARGENDVVVDEYGIDVFKCHGINAYPFTREALVEGKLKRVKELTLEKMLVGGQFDYVLRGKSKISVEELKGKDIIVFYGCIDDNGILDKVGGWYNKIKRRLGDKFEIVFLLSRNVLSDGIEFNISGDELLKVFPSDTPWVVCPFDRAHADRLRKVIDTLGERSTLVEFGKDGQICSFRAQDLLTDCGPDEFPFSDDNLPKEVIAHLRNITQFMDDFKP